QRTPTEQASARTGCSCMGLLSRRGGAQQRRKDAVIVREIPLSPFSCKKENSRWSSPGRLHAGRSPRRRGNAHLAPQTTWQMRSEALASAIPRLASTIGWRRTGPEPARSRAATGALRTLTGPRTGLFAASVGSIPDDLLRFRGSPRRFEAGKLHPEGLTPP